jgi:hypothetical protein
MVDCIYAAHINDENNDGFDFEAISEKLQIRHLHVKEHPLYGILMANKCGEDEVVQTFLGVLNNELVIFSLLLLYMSFSSL